MHANFTALESDWLRYYNRNFAQDLYGVEPIGFRYIYSLIVWLPSDAALWRSMGSSWSDEKELLAVNIEVLDALRRAFIVANSKKNAREPAPIKITRPWQKLEQPAKRGTSLGALLETMQMRVRKQIPEEVN